MKVQRYFTKPGSKPLDNVEYEKRHTKILNADGTVVFEMRDAWVPKTWSRLASDIIVSKYFRKAGVPQRDEAGEVVRGDDGEPVLGPEKHTAQVISRMTKCWRRWGERFGMFSSDKDASNFEAELDHMLVNQMSAPNSPQWFNTGLSDAYGISGPAQGHFYFDPDPKDQTKGEVVRATDSYSRPQPHACFIQDVQDNLVNDGGIMDLWVREARLFKYGSGTGTNFSAIRGEGEPLAGGGISSGLMSFLKIGDRAAGAIKSGGTTRRAAKMVCLDLDHPDIERFITWKAEEEHKAKILIDAGYDSDFNGEAYRTVSGQNSNNSVRIPNGFLDALESDGNWDLTWRTDGRVCKTVKARDLMDKIAESAWACADPGIQFDDTINEWHTCPTGGRIKASNPCSEYMFLDDTACNLASLNLKKFYDEQAERFDIEGLRHAIRLWTMVLEISVGMASYPSESIAKKSYEYRTIGLGHANIGSLLMTMGIPYDSDEGRTIAGAFTAVLTGESYATSAEIAGEIGAFPCYPENRDAMLRVIRNHRRAAYDAPTEEYEALTVPPVGLSAAKCPQELIAAARQAWDRALSLGEQHGYRNAQATVIAPTGTIGLLMDCDTTGVEPDFSLVKLKKLAGGGVFKICNNSVGGALKKLGYGEEERDAILAHVLGTSTLKNAPGVSRARLLSKGLHEDEVDAIDQALTSAFSLQMAVTPSVVGEEAIARLGIDADKAESPTFDLLTELGFSASEIAEAEDYACGFGTIEGAPHLKDEHLAVFDCANRCGKTGKRFIRYMGHVEMMAATQSFVSGAISKTINMPHEVTVDDIETAYLKSWKLGLKALALYRDGCKSSQPLNSKVDDEKADDAEPVETADTIDVAAEVDAGEPMPAAAAADVLLAAAAEGRQVQPIRRKLPGRRMGFTQEARIGGTKVYLRTGEYDDGTLGEIFIDLAKEGAAFRSMMNCFAISVSLGLQHGVPLKEFVDCFTFTRFEPQGRVTNHPNIKMSTSVVDYVFRVLAMEYLGNVDLVHVKPGDSETRELVSRQAGPGGDASRRVEATALPEARPSRMPEGSGNGNGNGNGSGGNGHGSTTRTVAKSSVDYAETAIDRTVLTAKRMETEITVTQATKTAADEHHANMMGDAPFCDTCGHITVRNGSCYRCLNCGNSMGCS